MQIEIEDIKNKHIKNNFLREQNLKRIEKEKEMFKPVDFIDFNENIDKSNEKFKNMRSNINIGQKNSYFKQLDYKELPNSERETNKLPSDIIEIVNKLVDFKLKKLLRQNNENNESVLSNQTIKDTKDLHNIKNL